MTDGTPHEDPYLAQTGFALDDAGEYSRDEVDIEAERADGVEPAPWTNDEPDAARDAEQEDLAVEHVAERLVERFPEVPAEVVEETVAEAHESLSDARVRDFIPPLVEHEARERLRELDPES